MKIMKVAVMLGVVGAFSSAVQAGEKVYVPVQIWTNPNGEITAAGSLGSARNTDDDEQDIGCYVEATTSGTTASCIARTLKGVEHSCVSTNEHIVKVVAALDGDGLLVFNAREGGECTYVKIGKRSRYEPKVK